MTFKTQLSTDLDDFYDTDEFAETVTFNGSEITAIVAYDVPENIPEHVAIEAEIRVKVSDAPSPVYRNPVVIGSDTFYVYQDRQTRPVKTDDGLEWIIPLYRDERPVLP